MLTLFRRHGKHCAVHQKGLDERAKRFWLECECPIWLYGATAKGFYNRQSTGFRDMAAARALVASLEDGAIPSARGMRIREACDRFMAGEKLAERSMQAKKLLLERFTTFCERRGEHWMSGLSVALAEDFGASLPCKAESTRARLVGQLKHFLQEAFRIGWLAEDIGAKVRRPSFAFEQKKPFSEEEIGKLMATCPRLKKGNSMGFASKPETFKLLMELMLETGMRVSDAVRFDPKKLEKGAAFWLYHFLPKKTERQKRWCDVFVSDRLKSAIESAAWFSPERPFAFAWRNEYHMGSEAWSCMQALGRLAGVADARPHRLRDTFAVRCLLRGMQLEDVSRLLGHASIQTTERFYAAWIPERRARLERLLAESHADALGHGKRNP